MRTPGRKSVDGGCAAAFAALLLPAVVLAADSPEYSRPADHSAEAVERLQAPAAPGLPDVESLTFEQAFIRAISVPADGAVHRGGVMIDASSGVPGRLTVSETAKLDLARAAIEASRAAGTLFITHLPDDTTPATLEELAAMKQQQRDAYRSVAPTPDPIAGIGENIPPVQEVGPSGLSAGEQAKLRGETPSVPSESSIPSGDTGTAPISPEGDGAPVSKEGDSRE